MPFKKKEPVAEGGVAAVEPGPVEPVPATEAAVAAPVAAVAAPPTDAERIATLEMENAALRARLSAGSGPKIEMLGVQTGRFQCVICKGEGCRLCGGRGWNTTAR